MQFLQKIGKSLMLPIASLPVAAILLRLGVYISADIASSLPEFMVTIGKVMLSAGDAIFGNLGLIFAIGVAIGFSKDQHGASALSGFIGFIVLFAVMGTVYKIGHPHDLANTDISKVKSLDKLKEVFNNQITNYKIPGLAMNGFGGTTILPGITIGVVAGSLYNRFKDTKLPQALSFFGGKRLVPLLTSLVAIFLGVFFALTMPYLQQGVSNFAKFINQTRPFGYFIYGVANRLLIPTGLHHVLNSFFWFVTGHCANDKTITGDIGMFINHCKAASGFATPGSFQAGFFPVFMFGLPGAAFAMASTAKPENKRKVLGIMLGSAAVSFLTGITEPIEFSFMFEAPVLFVVHAVLTGISMVLTNVLGIFHGFSFSAGLFDYVLNYNIATKPLLLGFIGLGYFVIYFTVFKFAITKFNFKTLGRDEILKEDIEEDGDESTDGIKVSLKAKKIYEFIGGVENVIEVNNCTTRLRFVLKDTNKVDDKAIKELNVMGQIKVNETDYQVIIGPDVEFIADELRQFHYIQKNSI